MSLTLLTKRGQISIGGMSWQQQVIHPELVSHKQHDNLINNIKQPSTDDIMYECEMFQYKMINILRILSVILLIREWNVMNQRNLKTDF